MDGLLVAIPAVKKSVAFPDDLVKKLASVPLIQRVMTLAEAAVSKTQVCVVTDSEEIELICRRQDVEVYRDPDLRLASDASGVLAMVPYLEKVDGQWRDLLVLSPYAPLLGEATLKAAIRHYRESGTHLLVPVVRVRSRPFSPRPRSLHDWSKGAAARESPIESTAFMIVSRALLHSGHEVQPVAFPVEEELIEIRSYHDWWLCEKLLNRRRIVFRVIGHTAIGMGHIYRCLAVAHEISDHEVYFVCDTESRVAANQLAGYDYWLGVYDAGTIEQAILDLKPAVVVNDILDTDAEYIHGLRAAGIKTVNFEDLGRGAADADLVINDVFEEPQIPGSNIEWGHHWCFLRDEFNDAQPHRFQDDVSRLLITFGGTDPSDYARRVLRLVASYCANRGIAIDAVSGAGYTHFEELQSLARESPGEVTCTCATGVISQIMEKTELAICSNGRTVFELAHMNIPAVVLSHHEREKTHEFASEQNGFLRVDLKTDREDNRLILDALRRLVEDQECRRRLFTRMQQYDFIGNKTKVIERIQAVLKQIQ